MPVKGLDRVKAGFRAFEADVSKRRTEAAVYAVLDQGAAIADEYIAEDKAQIAARYLVPRALADAGLGKGQVVIPKGATIATNVLPRENSASPLVPESGLTQSTGSPASGAADQAGDALAKTRRSRPGSWTSWPGRRPRERSASATRTSAP